MAEEDFWRVTVPWCMIFGYNSISSSVLYGLKRKCKNEVFKISMSRP